MTQIVLTKKALHEATELMHPLDLKSLNKMIVNSARYSHPKGNRRYKEFIFDVSDGKVRSVSPLTVGVYHKKNDCVQCSGTGNIIAWDECLSCLGKGCQLCIDGFVKMTRNCSCRYKK